MKCLQTISRTEAVALGWFSWWECDFLQFASQDWPFHCTSLYWMLFKCGLRLYDV